MKKCCQCGEFKIMQDFGNCLTYSDGKQKTCKICKSKNDFEYRNKNKEKIQIQKNKAYKNNKSYYKEKAKDWSVKNKEKVYAIHKKHTIAFKEKIAERKRKVYLENKESIIQKNAEWKKLNRDSYLRHSVTQKLKKQIGEKPPQELVEVKLLINKTKLLCKTSKNLEMI